MSTRFLVTLTKEAASAMNTTIVEEVGADTAVIHESGALVFVNYDYEKSAEEIVIVYAPRTWVNFLPVAD